MCAHIWSTNLGQRLLCLEQHRGPMRLALSQSSLRSHPRASQMAWRGARCLVAAGKFYPSLPASQNQCALTTKATVCRKQDSQDARILWATPVHGNFRKLDVARTRALHEGACCHLHDAVDPPGRADSDLSTGRPIRHPTSSVAFEIAGRPEHFCDSRFRDPELIPAPDWVGAADPFARCASVGLSRSGSSNAARHRLADPLGPPYYRSAMGWAATRRAIVVHDHVKSGR
jgi:hypothetical protein